MRKIILSLVLLLLAGCSGKPSNGEIENQVVADLLDGMEDVYQIENFEKLNGFEQSRNTYVAEVRYDIVFKKSLREVAQDFKEAFGGSDIGNAISGLGLMGLNIKYGNFQAGHRVTKEEKILFINTENGWQISRED